MRASFFPSNDEEPEPEPRDVFVPPPWFQSPPDEYPAQVPVREFLARTQGTVLSVSHVDVYSTGIAIQTEWELRRRDEPLAEWQSVLHGDRFSNSNDMLRFGVAMANRVTVTTVDRSPRVSFTEQPDGWSLMNQGGGGGGDDRRFSGSNRLWLWPLPPAGPIELVGEWAARGIPESRIVLDGASLLTAVADVRPLWPQE